MRIKSIFTHLLFVHHYWMNYFFHFLSRKILSNLIYEAKEEHRRYVQVDVFESELGQANYSISNIKMNKKICPSMELKIRIFNKSLTYIM